jgi:hypothetical protein
MTETKTFYLLVCRDCTTGGAQPLPIPFGSARERGQWATAHTTGTGHDHWWVHDQTVPTAPICIDGCDSPDCPKCSPGTAGQP